MSVSSMFELKQYSGIQEEIIWGGDSICETNPNRRFLPTLHLPGRLIIKAFPPAYAFVGGGEPFYEEIRTYINQLKKLALRLLSMYTIQTYMLLIC